MRESDQTIPNATLAGDYKRAAEELQRFVCVLLDDGTTIPDAPIARLLDQLPVGTAIVRANRAMLGRDAISANAIPCEFQDGKLKVLEYARGTIDEKMVPDVELRKPDSPLPPNSVEPPNGLRMLLMRGAQVGTLDNIIALPAETYLTTSVFEPNAGRRPSTRVVETLNGKTNQNMVGGLHFLMCTHFSPTAYRQLVGGPQDVARDPQRQGGGQVPMLNAVAGSDKDELSTRNLVGFDSYAGEGIRFVTSNERGQSQVASANQPINATTPATPSQPSPSVPAPRNAPVPNVQEPRFKPQVKHPTWAGKIPQPIRLHDGAVRNVGRIVSSPRATTDASLFRSIRISAGGPLIADGSKTSHLYASRIDPETGAQVNECAGAISTEAFFKSPSGNTLDAMYFDAPEKYHYRDLLPPQPAGWVPIRSYKAIDPDEKHVFEDIEFDRRWDREVYIPVRSPSDPSDASGEVRWFGEDGDETEGGEGGGGEGYITPNMVQASRDFWQKERGTHGMDAPAQMEALGFTAIPLPARTKGAAEGASWAGSFAQINPYKLPSPYDIARLEAFEALPRGGKTSAFYRAKANGQPEYENFDKAIDGPMMRRRASTAQYIAPAEVDIRKGVYPDTVTKHVVGIHPSVPIQFGHPYPQTDDLIREGWRIQQEADDSDALAIDYIGSDGAVDGSKVLKVNGSAIAGGFWDRTGTTLSPTNSGDDLLVDGVAAFGDATISALNTVNIGKGVSDANDNNGIRVSLATESGATGDNQTIAAVATMEGTDNRTNNIAFAVASNNDATGGTVTNQKGFAIVVEQSDSGSAVTNAIGADIIVNNTGGGTRSNTIGVKSYLNDNSTNATAVEGRVVDGTHTTAIGVLGTVTSSITISSMAAGLVGVDTLDHASGRSAAIYAVGASDNIAIGFGTATNAYPLGRIRFDSTDDTFYFENNLAEPIHINASGTMTAQAGFQGKYVAVDTAGATHNGAWGEDVVINNTTGSGTITINVPAVGGDETNLNKAFTVQIRRTGVSVVVAMDGADTVFDDANTAYVAGEWTVTSGNTGKISIHAGDERHAYACCIVGGNLVEPE